MENKIQIQRIAAKAIIKNEQNKVLILREASTYQEGTNIGKYVLPGGRVEIGEPYFDGLIREVREETGLDIVVEEPIFVSEWFPVIKGIPHQIVGIFFTCQAVKKSITLSSEHDHYLWIDPNDATTYEMPVSDCQAIQKWNKSRLKHHEMTGNFATIF